MRIFTAWSAGNCTERAPKRQRKSRHLRELRIFFVTVTEPKGGLLVPLAKAGVSIALLLLLLSRVDVGRLWHVARSASLPWLAGALALYYLMIAVSAWRWGLLLDAQGVHFPFSRLSSSFLVAT